MKLFEASDINIGELMPQEVETLCSQHLSYILKSNSRDVTPYRGMDIPSDYMYYPEAFTRRVRMDRKPRDMPQDLHDLIDDIYEELTGKRLRSQSAFVSNSVGQAKDYGDASFCVLLPNAFDLYYLENIKDMFVYMNEVLWHKVSHLITGDEYNRYNAETRGRFRLSPKALEKERKLLLKIIKPAIAKNLRRCTNVEQVVTHFIGSDEVREGMLYCDEYGLWDSSTLNQWKEFIKNQH